MSLGPNPLDKHIINISVANLFVLPVKFGRLTEVTTNKDEFNARALGAGFELIFVVRVRPIPTGRDKEEVSTFFLSLPFVFDHHTP